MCRKTFPRSEECFEVASGVGHTGVECRSRELSRDWPPARLSDSPMTRNQRAHVLTHCAKRAQTYAVNSPPPCLTPTPCFLSLEMNTTHLQSAIMPKCHGCISESQGQRQNK